MPSRTPVAALAAAALVAAAALGAGGCGSSDEGSSTSGPSAAAKAPVAAVKFPRANGRTLPDLYGTLPEGPILAPSVSLLQKGSNRFGFALFDASRKQLTGAQVALYTARTDGTGVRGPFTARSESLRVKAPFVSKTTSQDPDAASSVYVADVPLARNGKTAIVALVKLDGRLMHTKPQGIQVGVKGATPPGPGDRAIPITTATAASAGGDLGKIDTRVPPAPSLLRDDFRAVLGKKPVVLMFATPQLCQSRVCGPVVDVALQVQSEVGDKVSFVHQEVYVDNDVNKGIQPQLAAWHLASEPWIFVIDRKGIVRSRFEGALSADELKRAVDTVR
jgi:hypothetical protein